MKAIFILHLSGEIRTHDRFDYEIETSFNFTVVATDGGKEGRTDTCEVSVNITDVNDQSPSFARDIFRFTVSEFAQIGKKILHIQNMFIFIAELK